MYPSKHPPGCQTARSFVSSQNALIVQQEVQQEGCFFNIILWQIVII